MGGFFGVVNKNDAMSDVFFGTDYHSHLGTRRGGIAAYDKEIGLQRDIHNIANSPFRTKFENIFDEMSGNAAIGCISDFEPQPLLMRSRLGAFAISFIGTINNAEKIIEDCLVSDGKHFAAMTGGKINSVELVTSLISCKETFAEGIKYAQEVIDGSASILILTERGSIIAARDKYGRLPILVGRSEDGYAIASESFSYQKLGYQDEKELGPGEIVEITADSLTILAQAQKKKKICAFLWSYYGYPTSCYEGVNVEVMRYRNGEIMARNDKANNIAQDIDYVGGVPDSGTPHAIGYANKSGKQFARAFIKYTPTWARSFIPKSQKERSRIAKMKQIPIHELITDKKLLFVDDSIVRGTQLKETVDFLYQNGAKEVHMRSACPPLLYSCKYLSFSRNQSDMDLIARRVILELEGEEGFKHIAEYSDSSTKRGKNLRKAIADKFNFASLEFQTIEGIVEAIGLDKNDLCTYCWDGKE